MAVFDYNKEALANLKIEDTSILDRLVDFEGARKAHLSKERAKKDKRISLKEAVAEFVSDGDVVLDTGFGYVRTCIQSHFEIVRQGKKNLQMIGAPNTNQSYMSFAGCVYYSHSSYTGAEMRGTDKNYKRMMLSGKLKVVSEWSHGGVGQGLKAAQLGCPGVLSKQMLASDIVRYNPYLKVIQNPMKQESDPVVFIPALYPDIVFIHAQVADKYGNAWLYGPTVNDVAGAAASKKVVITAEEIVPEMDIRNNRKGTIIPFFYANAVVELPYGALPGSMPGCYYWPRQWWEKLMRYGGASDENMKKFVDEWIFGTKDQIEFVEKLGGAKWIIEARRQTKAAEGDNEDIDFAYQEYRLDNDPGIYY